MERHSRITHNRHILSRLALPKNQTARLLHSPNASTIMKPKLTSTGPPIESYLRAVSTRGQLTVDPRAWVESDVHWLLLEESAARTGCFESARSDRACRRSAKNRVG